MDVLTHYREIMTDPAHLMAEVTLMLLIDVLFLGLIWPLVKHAIRREHLTIDAEHGVVDHGEGQGGLDLPRMLDALAERRRTHAPMDLEPDNEGGAHVREVVRNGNALIQPSERVPCGRNHLPGTICLREQGHALDLATMDHHKWSELMELKGLAKMRHNVEAEQEIDAEIAFLERQYRP